MNDNFKVEFIKKNGFVFFQIACSSPELGIVVWDTPVPRELIGRSPVDGWDRLSIEP